MGISDIPAADLAKYRELIGDCGVHSDQGDQVILIVRNIMKTFVDAAFQNTAAPSTSILSSKNPLPIESSCDNIQLIQTMQPDFAEVSQPEAESVNARDVQYDQEDAEQSCYILPR